MSCCEQAYTTRCGCVSIPIGFSMSCNGCPPSTTARDQFQSYRVSNELQQNRVCRRTFGAGFNPIRVFNDCNARGVFPGTSALVFQSLSGFPMVATSTGLLSEAYGKDRFQSLSGFPMSCNTHPPPDVSSTLLVSIPIGFSNELQRRMWGDHR